jgi:hypothetical protein
VTDENAGPMSSNENLNTLGIQNECIDKTSGLPLIRIPHIESHAKANAEANTENNHCDYGCAYEKPRGTT